MREIDSNRLAYLCSSLVSHPHLMSRFVSIVREGGDISPEFEEALRSIEHAFLPYILMGGDGLDMDIIVQRIKHPLARHYIQILTKGR